MRKNFFASTAVAAAMLVLLSLPATAQRFSGEFSGFNELGALNNQSGAILSNGEGTLKLTLDKDASTISYELTYSGLSSNVLQSHIHFGRVHSSGGIMVFLCTNLGNGPAGTPTCPATGGTVTGTITASGVRPIPTQNVTAGDFDAITAALLNRAAYGNLHTANFPAGEIRAEVRRQHDDDDDHDDKSKR